MIRFSAFLPLFVILLFSCDDADEIILTNEGILFYPEEEGFFRIYEVDEILFRLGEEPDTINFFLKEVVGPALDSISSESRFLVNYFTKSELVDSISWRLSYTVLVRKDETKVIETIDNIPVIKLVYPFVEELRWDANATNTQPQDQFEMRDVNEEFDNQILTFANSVSIYQSENLDSLISRDFRKEIYAREVGLVQVEIEQLDFCQDSDCFGQGEIDEGRIYSQTIIEFGIE